jgi:hypothetical protein
VFERLTSAAFVSVPAKALDFWSDEFIGRIARLRDSVSMTQAAEGGTSAAKTYAV